MYGVPWSAAVSAAPLMAIRTVAQAGALAVTLETVGAETSPQDHATLFTAEDRLAGPLTEVVQEYPARLAETLLHTVPCGIPLREKFPEASAVTFAPQTETVWFAALAQNEPETA